MIGLLFVLASTFPLVPGVDWSHEAVTGYFTGPRWTEPCSITVRQIPGGYELDRGGRISSTQRFVGCIGGVAVFQ